MLVSTKTKQGQMFMNEKTESSTAEKKKIQRNYGVQELVSFTAGVVSVNIN